MRKTPNFFGVSLSRLFGVISERIGAVFIFRTFDRECADIRKSPKKFRSGLISVIFLAIATPDS